MGRRLRQGDLRPLPTVEQAERELAAFGGRDFGERGQWPRHVVGSPQTLRAQLAEIRAALALEELMIVTLVHDHRAHLRSYALLARAIGLERC